MAIIFRPIEKSDNKIIAQIIRTALTQFGVNKPGTVFTDPTTDNLYELFKTPKSKYWICEEDGEIIGGCGIFPTEGLPERCAELVKLYLTKKSRGKGLGKALALKSIETAKEFGFKQLYLESFPELESAVRIYEKLGFKQIGKPLGDSGHHACNYWAIANI